MIKKLEDLIYIYLDNYESPMPKLGHEYTLIIREEYFIDTVGILHLQNFSNVPFYRLGNLLIFPTVSLTTSLYDDSIDASTKSKHYSGLFLEDLELHLIDMEFWILPQRNS